MRTIKKMPVTTRSQAASAAAAPMTRSKSNKVAPAPSAADIAAANILLTLRSTPEKESSARPRRSCAQY
jgi:hypothetical protein